jgi:endonuclease YncB( thermonuclease family)
MALPVSELSGKIVGIADGDTVTLLDASNTSYRIRLLGIDAPEKAQPFGKVSKQVLSDRIFGKNVQLQVRGNDRYGRTLGKIRFEGSDINLELVREGLAWHYKHYASDQFPGDAVLYAQTEQEARSAQRGLWAYPDPIEPWVWRHGHMRMQEP